MKLSCFSLLMILLLSPVAYAGPSDGGGTNLFEDQLVDFQKFEKEFGVKQYVVDGRKMKARGGITPYEDVKPLLDRFRYLYPGVGDVLEETFEKDWIVLDSKFTARKTGETKAISQTDNVIYVSLPWLKRASQARVREALTHEAVRNLAQRMIKSRGFSQMIDKDVLRSIEDEFTEAVTPVVHRRLPVRQLDQTLNAATEKMSKRMLDAYRSKKTNPTMHAEYERPYFSKREHYYKALKLSNEVKSMDMAAKLCAGIHSKTRFTDEIRKKLEERIEANREQIESDIVGYSWFVSLGDHNYDYELGDMVRFHRSVIDASQVHAPMSRRLNGINNLLWSCQNGVGNEPIRKEAERDGYRMRDPNPRLHEEVPLEEASGVIDVR